MTLLTGKKITFSTSGVTNHIHLGPGIWNLDVELGGGEATLQNKSPQNTSFKDALINDLTTEVALTEDRLITIHGNIDIRLDVTTYSAPGSLIADRASD